AAPDRDTIACQEMIARLGVDRIKPLRQGPPPHQMAIVRGLRPHHLPITEHRAADYEAQCSRDRGPGEAAAVLALLLAPAKIVERYTENARDKSKQRKAFDLPARNARARTNVGCDRLPLFLDVLRAPTGFHR